jgi:lipopolysaccharide/colanic/teichoic acid biosynthesis glycosyltransferase
MDELPQLWNVLRGEMSLVGSRPESLPFASLFEGRYRVLLEYTPGLLGPNQEFPNEIIFPKTKIQNHYRRICSHQSSKETLNTSKRQIVFPIPFYC